MHVPATLTLFATILALLVLLRLRWPRFSRRLRITLIAMACIAISLQCLGSAVGWGFSSNLLALGVRWSAVAGYEFLILLITLLRPRWLTIIIAIVLIAPLFSATAFLPLAGIFDQDHPRYVTLTDHLYTEILPWDSLRHNTSGVDVAIYLKHPYIPFLQRRLIGTRLYYNQCDTSALVVTLQPDHKHVLIVCPTWPAQPADIDNNFLLSLP